MTLVAEVHAPDPVGPLLFVNNNPNYQYDYELERELQAVAAARFIEELVGERRPHVVLAGDFDAYPDAASIRFWRGRQSLGGMSVAYRNAWEAIHPDDPGHTFTPSNPLVPSRSNPMVVDGERIFDEPVGGVWASDHFGVMADLAVPS